MATYPIIKPRSHLYPRTVLELGGPALSGRCSRPSRRGTWGSIKDKYLNDQQVHGFKVKN